MVTRPEDKDPVISISASLRSEGQLFKERPAPLVASSFL